MSVIFCSAAAILEMSALCSETVCSSLSILYIISRSVASCDFLFSLAPERAIISWQAMLAAAAMNAAITASMFITSYLSRKRGVLLHKKCNNCRIVAKLKYKSFVCTVLVRHFCALVTYFHEQKRYLLRRKKPRLSLHSAVVFVFSTVLSLRQKHCSRNICDNSCTACTAYKHCTDTDYVHVDVEILR